MEETKKHSKILLAGGHAATTALATIQGLFRANSDFRIYWIGPRTPIEGEKTLGIEDLVFPGLGVKSFKIVSGRLQRRFTRYSLPSLFKIPFSFFHAFYLVYKIRPRVLVSFGGYSAFPVVFSSWLFRIPVIVHEQTVAVGLSNKLSSRFAKYIVLAREQSKKFFKSKNLLVLGNPIMESILSLKPKSKMNKKPVIFVTCGSRGAQIINRAVDDALDNLLLDFTLIHQTGQLDFDYYKERKKSLPKALSKNYYPFSFIDPRKIHEFYKGTDMVIARSGANTVSELILLSLPSILIPIPWTRYNEQEENAKMAQNIGVSVVLPQETLSGESLLEKVREVQKNWKKMSANRDSQISKLDRKAAFSLSLLIQKCAE